MDISTVFDAIVMASDCDEEEKLEAHVAKWITDNGNWVCVQDLREAALENTDLVEPE